MYRRGDATGARLAYARLAEAGYEVAQSNAAWLLEAAANDAARARRRGQDTETKNNDGETAAAAAPGGACDGLAIADCERRALKLYEKAANRAGKG